MSIPLRARILLGRAAVQMLASTQRVEVLHIKGDAVDPALREVAASGTDIDVLLRPAHVQRFDRVLRQHGWSVHSTFTNGSPFGHAQTYTHLMWGYLDLHRFFPGIGVDPEHAFDLLWRDRMAVGIAGVECPVPPIPAQRLILLLNAARASEAAREPELQSWAADDELRRGAVTELSRKLDAEVALAAATGRLEDFAADRRYALWRSISQGGTRREEWWGRIRATPSWRERIRLLGRLPLVNVEHLTYRLGHAPSRREVVSEFFARLRRGLRERRHAVGDRLARR